MSDQEDNQNEDAGLVLTREQKTGRLFVFTLNNYTDEELKECKALVNDEEAKIKFIAWGYELSPSEGTPHLQGFLVAKDPCRWARFKKVPGLKRAHFQLARGTFAQCKVYCTKSRTKDPARNPNYEEFGVAAHCGQGSRTDICRAVEMIQEHKSAQQVAEQLPLTYVRMHRGLEALAHRLQRAGGPKKVFWIHGGTGLGKTYAVYAKFGSDVWVSDNNFKFFSGFNGHRVALFDDFRHDMCKFAWLLRLTDQYPMSVEIKGGSTQWNPEIVIITCTNSIDVEFSGLNEDIRQLKRRVHKVFHVTQPNFQLPDDLLL